MKQNQSLHELVLAGTGPEVAVHSIGYTRRVSDFGFWSAWIRVLGKAERRRFITDKASLSNAAKRLEARAPEAEILHAASIR